jgi:hypothetical protein
MEKRETMVVMVCWSVEFVDLETNGLNALVVCSFAAGNEEIGETFPYILRFCGIVGPGSL